MLRSKAPHFSPLGMIDRFKVQDRSLNLQIPLGIYPGGNLQRDSIAMAVLPGHPSSLLVALSDSTVTVFDDAVARPSGGGVVGNSVVLIDPATGVVVDTIYAGSEPGAVALSADGSHLFAPLGGAPAKLTK
jgi:hypothetical protein